MLARSIIFHLSTLYSLSLSLFSLRLWSQEHLGASGDGDSAKPRLVRHVSHHDDVSVIRNHRGIWRLCAAAAQNEASEEPLFACKATKLPKETERHLLITSRNLYVFGPKDYSAPKRVLPLAKLGGVISSSSSEQLVLNMRTEYDLHLLMSTAWLRHNFTAKLQEAHAELDPSMANKLPLPAVEEEAAALDAFVFLDTNADLALKASLNTRFALQRKSVMQAHRASSSQAAGGGDGDGDGDAAATAADKEKEKEFTFDFLNLARVPACLAFLVRSESEPSPIVYSDVVTKINERGVRQSVRARNDVDCHSINYSLLRSFDLDALLLASFQL